jgi:hypothetical protein
MKKLLKTVISALRELFRKWGALIILLVLYLAMLGAAYMFFVTRESTVGLLLLSFFLALVVPILFLVIQTMSARYNRGNERSWSLLLGSLRDFWKLLVISLPIILIAILAAYLFGKIETNTPATTVREAARALPAPTRPVTPKTQPLSWQSVAVTTIEYLLFLLVLPLASIHVWIGTAREGLKNTFRQLPRVLARAFSPQSVMIYLIGFVFFAVVPYFLIISKTPASNAWLDVGLLLTRLLLAVLFSLIGWVVTVGALANRGEENLSTQSSHASEGPSHVRAEA